MPQIKPISTTYWDGQLVEFFLGALPEGASCYAVIVFAWHECGWVLADIPDRGWCVPSGRIEAGETPEETAIRETFEEIGSIIKHPQYFGYYRFTLADGITTLLPTFYSAVSSYGNLPIGTESMGVRIVSLDELPQVYWRWDKLLATVFRIAGSFHTGIFTEN